MAGPTSPSWLRAADVATAPQEPGLYAWYATLVFGPQDWQLALDASGKDTGMASFGALLADQTSRLVPPTIRIGAVGHLWAKWSGPLKEGGSTEVKKAIGLTHTVPASGPSALRTVMQREELREATAQVLATCAPQVSAPIYIGVATNLRTRLKQHLTSLRDGIEAIDGNGGTPPPELRKSFGGRAAAVGFNEETLSVATFPVAPGVVNVDDRRTIAEAAEFLLNRWSRPILGRQ